MQTTDTLTAGAPASGERRGPWLVDALLCLALLLIVCVPFREALFHPEMTPHGMDITQHFSRESVVRRALETTWLPLWNPYEFSGFPIQADLQTGVFYPPSVVLRLLPLSMFLTWTVIVHVWIFGIGGYLLCRVFGTGRMASFAAAIGLMLGGVTVPRVYAGHLDVLRTVAWVPLALAAAVRSIDRGRIAPAPSAVLILAMEVLAGFLQLVVYTGGAIALYALYAAVWPRRGERSVRGSAAGIAQVAVMMLLTLGVTAFQLLPTARLVMTAGRAGGIPLHNAVETAVALGDVPSMMFAAAPEGDVPHESWEMAAYVGWPLALLAPLALASVRRWRTAGFFVLLGGIALLMATGGYLFALHHSLFPMFRIPGRFMPFWAIAVAVLGASALDAFAAWSRSRAWPVTIAGPLALVAVAALVLIDMLAYDAHFVGAKPLADQFATSAPVTPSPFGRVLSLCEGSLFTSELTALGIPSVDGYNSYFLGDYAHIAERVRGEPPAEQRTAFPRMGESGEVHDLGALSDLNVTELVSCAPLEMPGLEEIGRTDKFYVYRNHRAAGRVAVACPPEHRTPEHDLGICRDESVLISIGAADTPSGLLRFRVAQDAPHLLWLAEPYYPERRAWIDGKPAPLEKTHIALSAIEVPAGTHEVELRFVPTFLYYGTAITMAVLTIWTAYGVRKRQF